MFGLPGQWEILIIFIIILLLFGAKRLPELAKGLGRGIREFKGAIRGEDENSKPKEIDEKKEEKGDKNIK